MAGRIRTIKPELLEDERTAGLSDSAWRVFVSLIVLADDYGNFRANADLLDGVIFWARRDLRNSSGAIRELFATGLLSLYSVRGQSYGHLRGWKGNQRVDKPGKPRCPSLQDADAVEVFGIPESLANDSGTTREPLANDSRLTSDLRPPTTTTDPEEDRDLRARARGTATPTAGRSVPVQGQRTRSPAVTPR